MSRIGLASIFVILQFASAKGQNVEYSENGLAPPTNTVRYAYSQTMPAIDSLMVLEIPWLNRGSALPPNIRKNVIRFEKNLWNEDYEHKSMMLFENPSDDFKRGGYFTVNNKNTVVGVGDRFSNSDGGELQRMGNLSTSWEIFNEGYNRAITFPAVFKFGYRTYSILMDTVRLSLKFEMDSTYKNSRAIVDRDSLSMIFYFNSNGRVETYESDRKEFYDSSSTHDDSLCVRWRNQDSISYKYNRFDLLESCQIWSTVYDCCKYVEGSYELAESTEKYRSIFLYLYNDNHSLKEIWHYDYGINGWHKPIKFYWISRKKFDELMSLEIRDKMDLASTPGSNAPKKRKLKKKN